METCGREIADEQAREAVKELGIGTPATRAAIITTLFKRDYIARSGKSIVPTEKGLHIYDAVKDMLVADVSPDRKLGEDPAPDRAAHARTGHVHGIHHGLHPQGYP